MNRIRMACWLTVAASTMGCVVVPPQSLVSDGSSDGSGSGTAGSESGAPTCLPAPDDIIGWWTADGQDAVDAVGTADGTVVGAVAFDSQVPEQVGAGEAFAFPGAASTVVIDNRPSLQVTDGDFTVALWARLDAYEGMSARPELEAGDGSLISKMAGANSQGWRIHYQGCAGTFWFCFGKTTENGCQPGYDTLVEAQVDVALHRWYAVAGVKQGDVIRMYVDGELQGSSTMTGYGVDDQADLRLGSWLGGDGLDPPGAGFLAGALDEVMLFDRALTDIEIGQLATQPVCLP